MKDWEGLTVGETLKRAGVDFGDVTLIDEPPGKLRALRFPYKSQDFSGSVTLEIQYEPELFDAERRWPQALVESQPVTRVLLDSDRES